MVLTCSLFVLALGSGQDMPSPPPSPRPAIVMPAPPVPAPAAKPAAGPKTIVKTAKAIRIDLKTQTLTALEGDQPVYVFNCSTGRNNATPRGEFPIRQKLRHNRALPKYGGASIPWSLRLDIVKKGRRVPIAIHAYKHVPRYPASHGCIRLKPADAERLFPWAEVGVRVSIQ